MGFFDPLFLLGLAGIGLPVYVHLLRQHVVPPQPFSSLMFFERGTQSSTRHRRLRFLLLFALRAALLLLLALAFANPFVRLAGGKVDSKLMLIAVDDSFSMRAGSRLGDAKQGALQLLGARPPAQRAQIMALGSRLAVLTQPTQDGSALRSAVQSVQPGDARANLGELARGLRVLADTVHTPVELHLFSDMQKTAVPTSFVDMALPENVTVTVHQVGETSPNWAVESVTAPAQITDPKRARVQAVIAGYGTNAISRSVSLLVNGKAIATRKVQLPADGRATVEFPTLDVPYGLARCAVTIDAADSLPADDVTLFAVKRSDPRRVLFVHEANDSRSALYFGAALAAANEQSFHLQSVESDKSGDVDPSPYAFVVLSNASTLPSRFENALVRYVSRGGNMLIAVGTSAARHAPIPVVGGSASAAHSYPREGYATVGETDLTHPVFQSNDDAGSDAAKGWNDLKIHYVAGVDATQARVIARLTDGTPLLLDKEMGEGHVLVFASGLDNLTNDLPLRPAFVPFVDRAARYLAGDGNMGGSRVVDSSLPLRRIGSHSVTSLGEVANGVDVLGPDGHRALSLKEAATARSFQLTRAGFYRIRFANGEESLIGVNPDRRESNLEPMPEALLQLWSARAPVSDSAGTAYAPPRNNARGIWWYVMLLVLLTAVAESVLASQYLGTQREEA